MNPWYRSQSELQLYKLALGEAVRVQSLKPEHVATEKQNSGTGFIAFSGTDVLLIMCHMLLCANPHNILLVQSL